MEDVDLLILQDLASRTAKSGIVSTSELSSTRPTWETWIMVSAKRRSLITMYLFQDVYNFQKGLPNSVADELQDIIVPGVKALWETRDRERWIQEYDHHLSIWHDGMLRLSELWQSTETGSDLRRTRIVRWLQSADEFGMMLFAVCAHIHGC